MSFVPFSGARENLFRRFAMSSMNHKHLPRVVLCFGMIVYLSAGFLFAQVPPERRATRENIVTLMLLRMTQVLDLSQEQTAQLFPLVNRVEKEKRALNARLVKEMRDLRQLVKEDQPDLDQMQRSIEGVQTLREAIRAQDNKLEAFVVENLSVRQQAKFLIFFQDFNRFLQEKLREARERQRTPPVKK
jgi:hypothetical protein